MAKYNVVEKFVSINGEGYLAGQLAVFIRFRYCNLKCSYCDTSWANTEDAPAEQMDEKSIYEYIKNTGVKNITLTGGEPLLVPDIKILLELLAKDTDLHIEIETNGSVFLAPFILDNNTPSFTMDYKTPSSLMENNMDCENFKLLTKNDTVKFVVGHINDLNRSKEIIEKFNLINKCHIYFSPVFGEITPSEIVDFLIENTLNGVNLQLQMHKIIWDPNERGV